MTSGLERLPKVIADKRRFSAELRALCRKSGAFEPQRTLSSAEHAFKWHMSPLTANGKLLLADALTFGKFAHPMNPNAAIEALNAVAAG
jgi:hypothetical protein